MKQWTDAVLRWLGEDLDAEGWSRLRRYRDFLLTEAIDAGGIGPNEAKRIDSRHLADSLAFAIGLSPEAGSVIDVGSGVGLPGIPLAILRPQSHFSLLDRSSRRADLARRAVRLLRLDNVSVREGTVDGVTERFDGLVTRAAMAPREAIGACLRLLKPGGAGVIGWRRTGGTDESDLVRLQTPGVVVEEIRVPVLDSPASLLRIAVE